jgi:long-subunit acyl-CoA synthetase (AMP-forming)/acyl carrier protein
MYGITETCVHVTYRPLSKSDLALGAVSAIGVPIPDLQIYLLDSHGQVVPVGVPGEIYVGGAGLARGYLNRPDLTANKFLLNPFSAETGGWLYKSGDLARWWPDGQLEYLGRGDEQIKLRGYRIELGEIETAIRQYPNVQHAVVVAREDRPGDKRLNAYIVMASGIVLNADNLRRYLQGKLPAYMVPAAFIQLDVLPLTINGKVDHKALPAPAKVSLGNQEFISPSNQTERLLSKIWIDVLGIAQVRREANFFDIGGNSLLAIQVMTRIRDEFEIALPVQRIFEFPHLSELAAQIDLARFYQKHSSGLQEGINDGDEYVL